MPFQAPPPDFTTPRPAITAFSGYRGMTYGSGLSLAFDVTRRAIAVVRYGQTTYVLRRAVTGAFAPSSVEAVEGEFRVEGFPQTLVGVGGKPDEAYRDWIEQFQTTFQRLYVMRPFEMSDEERRTWGAIENLVDVERYRNSQPLIVRQVGRVSKARLYPLWITWEDGTRERVHLGRMPGEFATYRAGQPFEAVVHRDPITHRMVSVEYLKRLPDARISRSEREEIWNSAPTSASLPDADWG